MAGLARDKYCEQYQQCAALHDEKKWEECTRVGLRNMADCTMPPYFQIKTLILMVGAERDSWYKAECHRVEAEKIFAATKRLVAEQAPHKIAAQKTRNDAMVAQLRDELDDIVEYQANDAPSCISFEGSEYPEREGSLLDFLAAREMFAEADRLAEEEEANECDDDDDENEETEDDTTKVDVQTDLSLGMGDASIPLEGTAAVAEKEEHGDEQVIAEKLHNLTLDQEIQEASPDSKAKSKTKLSAKAEEVMSVRNLVASPTEKMQGKANLQPPNKVHWRPWE